MFRSPEHIVVCDVGNLLRPDAILQRVPARNSIQGTHQTSCVDYRDGPPECGIRRKPLSFRHAAE